ncbi:MAG: phosphodiester glycosidase family protein [Candidatus Binatia bacterium]
MGDWLTHRGSLPRLLWLVMLLLLPGTNQAQPTGYPIRFQSSPTLTITDMGSWRVVRRGMEFRKVRLERTEPYHLIDLKMVRLDTRWIVPHVVYSAQFNLKGADVKTLAGRSGAVAAINASYFDEKGKPLGFLKAAANHINRAISKSSLFTGIFGVKNRYPFIIHRDDFLPEQADEGVQAGPLLLIRGTPLPVTRGVGKQSRRSLIGMDKEQRLIIAVTDGLLGGLSWAEVQEFFGSEQWQAQTTDLLNLDGGGSAQLYVKGIQMEEHVPGSTYVPVALAFFSKAP